MIVTVLFSSDILLTYDLLFYLLFIIAVNSLSSALFCLNYIHINRFSDNFILTELYQLLMGAKTLSDLSFSDS